MPIDSYFEPSVPRHVKTGSAGDHTRHVRLLATVAPYINKGVAAAPTLGWKSNELSAQARLVLPIYGSLNAFIPNRR